MCKCGAFTILCVKPKHSFNTICLIYISNCPIVIRAVGGGVRKPRVPKHFYKKDVRIR